MGMALTGRKVLVVGLARSGVAAARLAAARGARVTVTDRRSAAELEPALRDLGPAVRAAVGGHDAADFTGADLVVVSPGVPLALPERGAARWACSRSSRRTRWPRPSCTASSSSRR